VVIRKTGPKLGDYEFTLFARPKDPRAEQWKGPWSGLRAALDVFNADVGEDIGTVHEKLPEILKGVTNIFADVPTKTNAQSPLHTLLTTLRPKLQPLAPKVHALRAIKSPA